MTPTRIATRLPGLVALQPRLHRDERGYFMETYNRRAYGELGIDADFVQDNHSRSKKGTLRGLHYQAEPGQPKLVRVARGAAYDVVVDLRQSSATFAQWEAFVLDDIAQAQLYVPIGFAHGFCALSDEVDFVYKVGSYYEPTSEKGIAWDDPDLAIPWPVDKPFVSDRDSRNPRLREVVEGLPHW